MVQVRLRRGYEERLRQHGIRLLGDQLWPRGVAKNAARLDGWVRAVARSDQLRSWSGQAQQLFQEFRSRYLTGLASSGHAKVLSHLQKSARSLTLLNAIQDAARSHAGVLLDILHGEQADGVGAEEGGDPACWQKRVCPKCGALADTDPPTICQQCQGEIPG